MGRALAGRAKDTWRGREEDVESERRRRAAREWGSCEIEGGSAREGGREREDERSGRAGEHKGCVDDWYRSQRVHEGEEETKRRLTSAEQLRRGVDLMQSD